MASWAGRGRWPPPAAPAAPATSCPGW